MNVNRLYNNTTCMSYLMCLLIRKEYTLSNYDVYSNFPCTHVISINFLKMNIFISCHSILLSGTNRPDGNRKGLLTRQRQPKLAAHVVRERYLSLAKGRDYHPESIFAQ